MTKNQVLDKIRKLEKQIEELDGLGLVFSIKCAESELKDLQRKLAGM